MTDALLRPLQKLDATGRQQVQRAIVAADAVAAPQQHPRDHEAKDTTPAAAAVAAAARRGAMDVAGGEGGQQHVEAVENRRCLPSIVAVGGTAPLLQRRHRGQRESASAWMGEVRWEWSGACFAATAPPKPNGDAGGATGEGGKDG